MSELTEFLLARIAEDEAVARASIEDDGGETGGMEDSFDQLTGRTDWFGAPVLPKYGDPLAALIVRAAVPARVLRECEAKRRIVEAFEEERVRRDIYNRDFDSGEYEFNANDLRARLASNAECRGLEIAILALASVYADHPDFDPAWT